VQLREHSVPSWWLVNLTGIQLMPMLAAPAAQVALAWLVKALDLRSHAESSCPVVGEAVLLVLICVRLAAHIVRYPRIIGS
jgi:hypothetical protein